MTQAKTLASSMQKFCSQDEALKRNTLSEVALGQRNCELYNQMQLSYQQKTLNFLQITLSIEILSVRSLFLV